jgi:hypothetical protein
MDEELSLYDEQGLARGRIHLKAASSSVPAVFD